MGVEPREERGGTKSRARGRAMEPRNVLPRRAPRSGGLTLVRFGLRKARMSDTPPECQTAGLLVPVIDRNRCEGKADCARVCPYDVFELGVLAARERAALSFTGKLKAFAHGGRQAFAVRPDACHGCGLCVAACPEKAIRLARASS
jgi:NAD-dependent dihydropyrimidine dehydrogenase PreA subunit